jgi:hypothetical protein
VLGREAAAQDVVGVGHQFDPGAGQVGVQVPGGQVQRLARRQRDAVEQQRGQHTGVPRVALRELEHRACLDVELAPAAGQPDTAVLQRGYQRVEHRLGQGDPRGEERPEAVVVGLRGEQLGVPCQLRNLELAEQPHRGLRHAEPDESVELGESADQLGLVVGVPVVAVCGVARDARGVLVCEARTRLLDARVRLKGEWLVGREHLEQERQRGVPVTAAVRAE